MLHFLIPVQASINVYAYATNTHAGLLMPVGEPLCLRAHPAEPIDASRITPMLTGTSC